jgi:hypothetical protein
MAKKLGWYEFRDDAENGLHVGIFSISWREGEKEPDCYYPDVILQLKQVQDDDDGKWYVNEMSITNPSIKDFADIGCLVLLQLSRKDPETISDLIKVLDQYFFNKIPESLAW